MHDHTLQYLPIINLFDVSMYHEIMPLQLSMSLQIFRLSQILHAEISLYVGL